MSADPIADAIAATQQVTLTQVQFTLSTGRPAMLAVPVDLTAEEALSLINGVTNMYGQLQAKRPASRIVLPS